MKNDNKKSDFKKDRERILKERELILNAPDDEDLPAELLGVADQTPDAYKIAHKLLDEGRLHID